MEIELFNSQESRGEISTKAIGYIISFLLFINSFFGYWISLDKNKFAPQVSDWSSLVAAIIIFYIVIELLSIGAFLSIIYTWPRYLYCAAPFSLILFIGGLTNVALRANGFCFFLLIMASIVYLLIGYHYQCLIVCRMKEHHITCRGSCKRSEDIHSVDEQFGGLFSRHCSGLLNFIGAGATSGATVDSQTRHIPFTNEEEGEANVESAEKGNNVKSGGFDVNGGQSAQGIATISSLNSSTLRTQRHRPQASSNNMINTSGNLLEVKSIEDSSRQPFKDSKGKPLELRADLIDER